MRKLYDTLNHFYYDISLDELKRMNADSGYVNISYNSQRYLDLIAFKVRCTPSELAGVLNVSKSAVAIKVNELIRRGLVEKTQSEDDKRVFYLTLSPKAATIYDEYDLMLLKGVKELEAAYPAADISKFCEMLDALRESFTRGD